MLIAASGAANGSYPVIILTQDREAAIRRGDVAVYSCVALALPVFQDRNIAVVALQHWQSRCHTKARNGDIPG